MKTRSGFVSNSSSSSFVIIATEAAHERALAEMKEDAAALIRKMVAVRHFGDQVFVFVGGHTCDGETYSYSPYFTGVEIAPHRLNSENCEGYDPDNLDGDPLSCAVNTYQRLISNDPDGVTLDLDS
jgi:hypothetical protein